MSRFIPAGESDLKALQAKEKTASSKFQKEEEDKEALSLYEQMRLNHIQKEQEYQENVKARNQPYKIDQREHRFYQQLREKEEEKERAKKRELEQGVQQFEQLKKQKPVTSSPPGVPKVPVNIDLAIPKTLKKKAPVRKSSTPTTTKESTPASLKNEKEEEKEIPPKKALVSGYSSSESDSE